MWITYLHVCIYNIFELSSTLPLTMYNSKEKLLDNYCAQIGVDQSYHLTKQQQQQNNNNNNKKQK